MGKRGRRKAIKRLTAPKSWMLNKLGGNFAPKPGTGPHKARECLPLSILLKHRLQYALNYGEVKKIIEQRLVKVDSKLIKYVTVRTAINYPLGFQDVITIDRTNENFRILYDNKGRFVVHRIKEDEGKYKLCRVQQKAVAPKGVPFVVTHDGRTIRYPDPLVKVNDSLVVDISNGKIQDFIKFDIGNIAMVIGGNNIGRVGTVIHRDRNPGSFDIVQLKDTLGHTFATRLSNVFIIGKGSKPWISLPKNKGVSLSIAEERDRRLAAKAK